MSAAPKDSDGPTAGTRTARLAEVWEAANALAAAQMPKQLSGSTRPSDISFESTNSVDHSSPIPLRHAGWLMLLLRQHRPRAGDSWQVSVSLL